MDYTTRSPLLKVKKAWRYVRLYGPRRTRAKVRGQYHMKRRYDRLPALATPPPAGGHVGFIGCGNFAFSTLAYLLHRRRGRVLRAAMDRNVARAASLYEAYGLRYYTDDADRLLEDPRIDLVYIASNHASHAEYAVRALRAGKSVHIEKPHVVSWEQLRELCAAMGQSPGRVALGFNRPHSRFGRLIHEHLAAERGPTLSDWFVVGHDIPPDHWYNREGEGGRVLGNLCHWTDFILALCPADARYPVRIVPTTWDAPDRDLSVSFVFGDGSIASLTYASRGYTFEGVREWYAAQRGDVIVQMQDFERLTIDVGDRKRRFRAWFRDPGHEARVLRSYAMVRPVGGETPGETPDYVWQTAELFLRTKEALDSGRTVVVESADSRRMRA